MSTPLPERPDLEQLKKQAKELQAAIRAGQPAALARAAGESAATITLAGAQRILAREYGFPSWAKLKLRIALLEHGRATARLVLAAINGDGATLAEIRRERPELARQSVSAAAVLADLEALRRWTARDPAYGWTRGGICDTAALGYVCLGRLGGDEAARVACAGHLLGLGADPNDTWVDRDDATLRLPILYAAAGRNDYPRLVRQLLAAGAQPNDGESVFHAAEANHRACLEALRAAGADFSCRDEKWRNTPLYFLLGWAPDAVNAPTVRAGLEWLLDHGADPNVTAYARAETPLHLAVKTGWPADFIECLLDHGADPAAARADGTTPYMLAVRHGRDDVAALLASRGAPAEAAPADHFLGACLRADEPAAREQLRQRPGLVRELTDEQRTVVFEWAKTGRAAAVGLLGDFGVDLAMKGEGGDTPLHLACWHGRAEVVGVLIARGVPLEEPDGNYHAPPIGWVAHGSQFCHRPGGDYPRCAELLLAAGVKVPPDTRAAPAVLAVLARPAPA